jgi:glutamyl-tRNA synthetase
MGYLPEALRNYLLRLGWSHGDDEIISTAQAIAWFDLDAVGRAPARFDFAKLANLNGNYIRQTDDHRLVALTAPFIERSLSRPLDETQRRRLAAAMAGLKPRAKTLVELAEIAHFYVAPRPIPVNDKAKAQLAPAAPLLRGLAQALGNTAWDSASLEAAVRGFAEAQGLKLGQAAQPLRAALTGSTASPPIFEVMAVLGRAESLARLADAAGA